MPLPTRPAYQSIALYSPGVESSAVDVSDNTNLWGAPPAALRVLREAPAASLTRYPVLYANELKAPLAAYAGVEADEVVTGCGSDDVIDACFRAFAEPGDRVAYPWPSFSMVPVFARMNGLEPVAVPLGADWDVDPEALVATGARIIYLCSPNNPTGTITSPAAIEHVVRHAPGIVLLDEAYAEFAAESFAARAPGWERVLVTRTLSKAFGLAGLRVGYGVGGAALVREVEKARGPYKVGALAEQVVAAVLGEDLDWVRARAAEAVLNRGRLATALAALGLHAAPSEANFLFVPTADAPALAARAQRAGVALRLFGSLPRDVPALAASEGRALRIGIGPWEVMEAVLAGLAPGEDRVSGLASRVS